MGSVCGFRHYHISVAPDGEPIALPGAEGEEVFLAMDGRTLRLCELHVLAAEEMQARDFQRAFYEAAEEYAGFRHPRFPEIVENGVDDGIPYYAVAYKDGEPLLDYLKRTGPQPAPFAIAMVAELAAALMDYRRHTEFHLPLDAAGLQVFRGASGRQELRVVDYGLAESGTKRHGAWEEDFARGCVGLLEQMLAGRTEVGSAAGGDSDGAVVGWSKDPAEWVDAMEIRESLAEFISEARGRRHLRLSEVVDTLGKFLSIAPGVRLRGEYRPEAGLGDAVVNQAGWGGVLRDHQAAMEEVGSEASPTALGRISSPGSVDREVRIHALPPGDVLPEWVWVRLRAVRDALSKPGECPALLRVLTVRPGGAAHLAEERVDGFSVAEMLASAGSPTLSEAHRILQKIRAALSQAEALKLPVHGRLEDQVLLTFRGMAGKGAGSDPWAGAEVRLRTHFTLASLLTGSSEYDENGIPADPMGAFLDLADRLIRVDGPGRGIDMGTADRIEQLFAEFRRVQREGSSEGDRASRKWSRGSFLRRMEGMARASERFAPGVIGRYGSAGIADSSPLSGGELASEEEVTEDPFEGGGGVFEKVKSRNVNGGFGVEKRGGHGAESDSVLDGNRGNGAEGEQTDFGSVREGGEALEPIDLGGEGEGVKVAESKDAPPPARRRGGWFRRRKKIGKGRRIG